MSETREAPMAEQEAGRGERREGTSCPCGHLLSEHGATECGVEDCDCGFGDPWLHFRHFGSWPRALKDEEMRTLHEGHVDPDLIPDEEPHRWWWVVCPTCRMYALVEHLGEIRAEDGTCLRTDCPEVGCITLPAPSPPATPTPEADDG